VPITATKAAKSFSDLLNRVNYNGETFVIERGGTPIAQLSPVTPPGPTMGEWLEGLRELLPPDPDFADDLERSYRRQLPAEKSRW
jgi:antitoxin (DNA-binding transcriptional repressor) of toxin-antitoxin stability system